MRTALRKPNCASRMYQVVELFDQTTRSCDSLIDDAEGMGSAVVAFVTAAGFPKLFLADGPH